MKFYKVTLLMALLAFCLACSTPSKNIAQSVSLTMNQHRGEIRECFDKYLSRAYSGKIKIILKFSIGTDGKTTAADVPAHRDEHVLTERCLIEELRSWEFAQLKGGHTLDIEYVQVFAIA